MRDGVRLYTLILTPKDAGGAAPVLLERTPYDATRAWSTSSTRLSVTRGASFLGGGYIFVVQDIRGRFLVEGDYAMYRVPRGAYAFDFIYAMETREGVFSQYPYEARDLYSWFLAQGNAGALGARFDAPASVSELWRSNSGEALPRIRNRVSET
jgi:predicted acyl esterase